MFFYLSKILWFFAAPSNLLTVLALLGALLCGTRFARAGRRMALAAAGLLLFIGIAPVGSLLFFGLEQRFPALPHEGLDPAGIVVLGGAVDEIVGKSRGQPSMDEAAERMTEAVVLARLYPDARLVFTGGSNAFFHRGVTEATEALHIWTDLGIPAARILLEDKSRNTYENAVFTRDLVKPQPGERWLLVTSAYHMPRSVSLFRKAGFPVTAFPVDFPPRRRWRKCARCARWQPACTALMWRRANGSGLSPTGSAARPTHCCRGRERLLAARQSDAEHAARRVRVYRLAVAVEHQFAAAGKRDGRVPHDGQLLMPGQRAAADGAGEVLGRVNRAQRDARAARGSQRGEARGQKNAGLRQHGCMGKSVDHDMSGLNRSGAARDSPATFEPRG